MADCPRSPAHVAWSRVRITPRCLWYASGDGIPNNSDLPVVLMPGAVGPGAGADAIRALCAANDWHGGWTGSVFNYHHYHPDAHEALIVARGWADIALGGRGGETLRVRAGDALVLPAGTGHCRIAASDGFRICGAYPPDQTDFETLRDGAAPVDRVRARIKTLPRPESDPVFGPAGPLTDLWRC